MDPYAQNSDQPQPVPPPVSDPYAYVQYQHQQAAAQSQPPANDGQSEYDDPRAVELARAKVAAADTSGKEQYGAYVPPPTPQLAPDAEAELTAKQDNMGEPDPEPSHQYRQPMEFETFELPNEEQPAPAHTAAATASVPAPAPVSAEQAPPIAPPGPEPASAGATLKPVQTPQTPASSLPKAAAHATAKSPQPTEVTGLRQRLKQFYGSFFKNDRFSIPERLRPFVGAIASGLIIFAVFNSQVIIGQIQYIINPGTGDSAAISANTASEAVGPEPLIIIPKINVSAPVVYDVQTFDEAQVQKALERGVVHYGTTAVPGQLGNNVIVGHSSNNWWASGKYKFAFVLLDKLEVGDTFTLHYQSKRYVYEVGQKRVVEPNDTSVLSQQTDVPVTTLITCTPAGTSLRRLIITAKQISPNPANEQPTETQVPSQIDSPLPGNTPSLWQQIKSLFD